MNQILVFGNRGEIYIYFPLYIEKEREREGKSKRNYVIAVVKILRFFFFFLKIKILRFIIQILIFVLSPRGKCVSVQRIPFYSEILE